MTYTHLTTDELVMIETYYHQNIAVTTILARLKRFRMTVYNVIIFLKEGDTIVGVQHKSAVITLVERLSKIIITLKPGGRKVNDIENTMSQWLESIPLKILKLISSIYYSLSTQNKSVSLLTNTLVSFYKCIKEASKKIIQLLVFLPVFYTSRHSS